MSGCFPPRREALYRAWHLISCQFDGELLAAVNLSNLADPDFIESSLDIGELVSMPGYPEGAFDGEGVRPICRTGRIASDPRYSYHRSGHGAIRKDGAHKLAIDGYLTGGSSGSPVFLNRDSDNSGDLAGSPLLLGIAVGNVDTNNEKHSGISYMHTSRTVQDVISTFI